MQQCTKISFPRFSIEFIRLPYDREKFRHASTGSNKWFTLLAAVLHRIFCNLVTQCLAAVLCSTSCENCTTIVKDGSNSRQMDFPPQKSDHATKILLKLFQVLYNLFVWCGFVLYHLPFNHLALLKNILSET